MAARCLIVLVGLAACNGYSLLKSADKPALLALRGGGPQTQSVDGTRVHQIGTDLVASNTEPPAPALKSVGLLLVVAAAVGCSAVFQGYAVEGIVEGTDGWPLALWAWAVGRERWGWSAVSVALCIVCSWYLGAVACLLVVLSTLKDRRALAGLLGVALAAPAPVSYTHLTLPTICSV